MTRKIVFQATLASGIGKIVRRERSKAGWTVEKLSLECGCTHQTVSNVERGSGGIRIITLLNILWAMDCSLAVWMEIAELDSRLRAEAGSAAP